MYIPYERQQETGRNRMCGAAALSMVYHSLGLTCTQTELWPRIAVTDRQGTCFAMTYLLCQNALQLGLHAVTIRAKDPLRILQICSGYSIRAILNHRLKSNSPLGHYTVLVDITSQHVIVHDPQFGQSRRITNADLLNLWQPSDEITGKILIALTDTKSSINVCSRCGATIAESISCTKCNRRIPLQPVVALGCLKDSCPERTWEHIICPYCDAQN